MENVIIPIAICVILPIAIVLIAAISKAYTEKVRSNILTKALETDRDIDSQSLLEAFKKPVKSPMEILSGRLLRGCIFSCLGIALLIISLVNYAAGGSTFSDDPVTVPLVFGGMSLAIGISFLIVYFATRSGVKDPQDK